MDEEYRCIFEPDTTCPVRTKWKLRPESPVDFCKVCPVLKRRAVLSLESLKWYQFFKDRGYPGNLPDFINECITNYIKSEGLQMGKIVKPKPKKEEKLEGEEDE